MNPTFIREHRWQKRRLLVALVGSALAAALCLAARSGEASEDRRPRLHLTCPQTCFDAFLRQELSYFDIVRDRYQADLAFVVVRQPAAAGGERFTATLLRPHASGGTPVEAARDDVTLPPSAPADHARRVLIQLLFRLLERELQNTHHARAFLLTLPKRKAETLDEVADPWNRWVIAPELKGNAEILSNYYWLEVNGGLTVRRITERHKLRLRAGYWRSLNRYVLEDGSDVRGDVAGVYGRALWATSIGRNWAVGGVAVGTHDAYANIDGHLHGGVLAELNAFPYAENASQQLRLAYQIGGWFNAYLEPNRAGLSQEAKPYHALSLILDLNQRWGSVQWIAQLNTFLDQPHLQRIATGVTLSLQLFEGFAFTLNGNVARVHDQISLRARPLTDLELLLGTAQQPTNVQADFNFGLSYTFGSIHNTVVNPRFGGVDFETD